MYDRDTLQRFLFDEFPVRGELVHLDASWQEVLRRHEYPDAVRNLLGEMLTASVLLSSTLKFEGSLLIQLQGSGPVRLAVAECTSDKTLRGLAQWDGDVDNKSFDELVGAGTLAITIDPEVGERYQGVVDCKQGSLTAAIEDYMSRSQQISTRIWLTSNPLSTAGMLLQQMPGQTNEFDFDNSENAEDWNRITHLAATIQAHEMLELPFQEILYRLFHEEDLRVFEKQIVSFRCSCTHERVRDMLRMIGIAEVRSILDEQGKIGVNCQFCNHYYEFDRVDAEMLFVPDISTNTSTSHH